jgi:hypothetical protein
MSSFFQQTTQECTAKHIDCFPLLKHAWALLTILVIYSL